LKGPASAGPFVVLGLALRPPTSTASAWSRRRQEAGFAAGFARC